MLKLTPAVSVSTHTVHTQSIINLLNLINVTVLPPSTCFVSFLKNKYQYYDLLIGPACPPAPEGAEAEGVLPSVGLQETEEAQGGEERGAGAEEAPST